MVMNVTTEYVNVPGGFVSLTKLGEHNTQRIPALYIHGGPGGNFYSFKPMAEMLAEHHTIYMYNQLGSDEANHTGEESLWTPDRYIKTLEAVVGGIGAQKLHLIGHSWGAYLAAEYLLRTQNAAIASITMVSPLLSTQLWIRDAKLRLSELGNNYVASVELCESQVHFDNLLYQKIIGEYNRNFHFRREHLSSYSQPGAFEPKTDSGMKVFRYMWGPSEFTCTGILKDIDLTARLREIKIPVMFVCGEFDQVRQTTCEYFRSLIPGSRMAIIPDASQTSYLEQPKIFYWTLRNFYERF